MTTGSRGRVRHTGDSSSSRGGGPIRDVPRTVNSSTSKTSVPYTVNSRSGDSRTLNQHHGYAGSTSHGGHADPLDDEDDDHAEDTHEYSDNEDDISMQHDTLDGRQFVTPIGEKLIWKEVPKEVVDKPFDIFKKRNLGRDPTFKELFFATHLTKDSKKKFLSGECQSMKELIFCTDRSKEAYGAYETDMLKKYEKQHDDSDLWLVGG